jgi:hypothetical protein
MPAIVRAFGLNTAAKAAIDKNLGKLSSEPSLLADFEMHLTKSRIQALVEVSCQAGAHQFVGHGNESQIIAWSRSDSNVITYRISEERPEQWELVERFVTISEAVPVFKKIDPTGTWILKTHFDGMEVHRLVGGNPAKNV